MRGLNGLQPGIPRDAQNAQDSGPSFKDALMNNINEVNKLQAEATAAESAISDMMRPLCGSHACGGVVVADKETMTMRVLSLLGAAFPDGSAPPTLAFLTP